ncbi:MAG: hypothetical protein ACRCT2_06995, partial [Plesiomonas shigelloides]
MDLVSAFRQTGGTPLAFGSEFKPPIFLQPLLRHHPFWNKINTALTTGVQTPLSPQSDATRRSCLPLAITRGNHKSAKDLPDVLRTLLGEEVQQGFALPLPVAAAFHLPNCWLAPLGIVSQNTIDAKGQVIPKLRLTHDLSWNYPPGLSPNARLQQQRLSPTVFGHCFSRILHYIADLRHRHPSRPIYLMKTDWSKAFRRLHGSSADSASSCCLVDDQIFLLFTRLTFGGGGNPSQFSDFSETTCDLINALQRCSSFDPEKYLHHLPLLVPDKSPLADHQPFSPAFPLSIQLEMNDFGKAENFLDDSIGIVADLV